MHVTDKNRDDTPPGIGKSKSCRHMNVSGKSSDGIPPGIGKSKSCRHMRVTDKTKDGSYTTCGKVWCQGFCHFSVFLIIFYWSK